MRCPRCQSWRLVLTGRISGAITGCIFQCTECRHIFDSIRPREGLTDEGAATQGDED